LRILFITPRFAPEIGGVEKHTYSVAKELVKRNHIVKILTFSTRNDLKNHELMEELDVTRISPTKAFKHSRTSNFVDNLRIRYFLIKNYSILINSDVIHLHDFQTFLWILPLILFIKKPIYITYHGFEAYPIPTIYRVIRAISQKLTDGSISVGQFISKWYGTSSNYITLGGINNDVPHEDFSFNNSGVFIGRLEKDTGIIAVIRSLIMLKEKYGVSLPLHVCGDGSLKSLVESQATENGIDVKLHGFVSNPQFYLMQSSFAFVTGYLAILEAMSYKRLIFSIYDNPLKKDYLYSIPNADNLMFICSSSEQMAENLFFALKNPEASCVKRKEAYSFAVEQTWAKVTNIYLSLYKQ
jgi:glycosyltransferase involved in cell wall biosynthesis